MRSTSFGYVELKVNVLHPLVYQHLITMRSLYKDIISGTKYAYFDKTEKDFVLADRATGQTGFTFFMKYLKDIDFKDLDSDQRNFRIQFIKKYSGNNFLINKWLVLPAGLRDYTVDNSGKPSEDEVNDIYRKLINTTQMLKNTNITDDNIHLLDPVRYKIQNIILDIYLHFKTLLDGKNKFIQGKWAKRAITYGTRNVITPPMIHINDLDKTDSIIGMNDTVCGLYQFAKGISPITMNCLNTKFISRIMNPDTTSTLLVDSKTMESTLVDIPANKRDEWLSLEGLDGILSKLGQESIRTEPIKIGNYYMYLVNDTGDTIELITNTQNLPEDYDRSKLRPITYVELVYLAVYPVRNKYPAFLTRYPVASLGGIYPTNIYLKTTVTGRTVTFKMEGSQDMVVNEYPILKEELVSSLSPNYCHLSRLTADFDGDMCSLNILYTDESIKEIDRTFTEKEYYITPEGHITYSAKTAPLEFILGHMTDF
jgi:hypothetical protein